MPDPAKPNQFEFQFSSFTYKYNILDIDYDKYALTHICQVVNGQVFEDAFIVSREKTLAQSDISKLNPAINLYTNLKLNDFAIVDQSC
jgi:hypothetical protein